MSIRADEGFYSPTQKGPPDTDGRVKPKRDYPSSTFWVPSLW